MSVTLDTSELDAFAGVLAAAGPVLKQVANATVATAADSIRDDASTGSPRLTGELAASWRVETHGDERVVTSDARQAFYQEFGTSRHGPQPSLFPAAERGERAMVAKLEVAVGAL